MGDIKYTQIHLSLPKSEADEWETLKAKGWKTSQVWKLGIIHSKRIAKAIDALDNDAISDGEKSIDK